MGSEELALLEATAEKYSLSKSHLARRLLVASLLELRAASFAETQA